MLFGDHYRRDANPANVTQDVSGLATVEPGAKGISKFLATHAGSSYEGGLYRLHEVADMHKWTELAAEAFPDFRTRICCFGSDWLGRMFALDSGRKKKGQYLILMLEPGTGHALEIPATFIDFHHEELVEYQNEALAAEFYEDWRISGGAAPALEECIGYKKPLFLSGSDTVKNLELTDMEVYWSITGQLLSKVRNLPDGTKIGDIHISE